MPIAVHSRSSTLIRAGVIIGLAFFAWEILLVVVAVVAGWWLA